jgi:GGDEF domain-containing protein
MKRLEPAPGTAEGRLFEALEAQARAAKASGRTKFSPAEVEKLVDTARGNLHELARRTAQPVEALASLALDRLARSVEKQRPAASLKLEQLFKAMKPDEQRRRYFTDLNTGLFNLRGLETLKPPAARPMLAEWDIEGAKFLNDRHGHLALNGAFRTAARALALELPDGAKIGGSLRGYVRDQAHANSIADAMEKALDPERRIRVTSAVAERAVDLKATIDRTAKAHYELKDTERRAGRLGHRLGPPVAFMKGAPAIAFEAGMAGLDPKSPAAQEILARAADGMAPTVGKMQRATRVEGLAMTEAHARAFASLSPREVAEALFIEPATGLLTEDGFKALPERRWKASVDLRALRELDQALGHEDTNKLIAFFGRAITKAGGADLDAAHLHGDEYVLQASSRTALKTFLSKVSEACDEMWLYKVKPNKSIVVVKGVQFAWGIGKDYDHADRLDLPKRKAKLPPARQPEVINPGPGRAGERASREALAGLRARGAANLGLELERRGVGGQVLSALAGEAQGRRLDARVGQDDGGAPGAGRGGGRGRLSNGPELDR